MKHEEIELLRKNIIKANLIDSQTIDAIIHALEDINNATENIYKKILPKLISSELSNEKARDLIWDIREEFRHVDYHIQDCNLLNL